MHITGKSCVRISLFVAVLVMQANFAFAKDVDWKNRDLEAKNISTSQLEAIKKGDLTDCAAEAKPKARALYPRVNCNPNEFSVSCNNMAEQNERLGFQAFTEIITSCMAKRGWLLIEPSNQ